MWERKTDSKSTICIQEWMGTHNYNVVHIAIEVLWYSFVSTEDTILHGHLPPLFAHTVWTKPSWQCLKLYISAVWWHVMTWCISYESLMLWLSWHVITLATLIFVYFLCLLFYFLQNWKKTFRCKYLCSWASCHKMTCVMWKPYARLSCPTTGLAQLLLIYQLCSFSQSWQDFEEWKNEKVIFYYLPWHVEFAMTVIFHLCHDLVISCNFWWHLLSKGQNNILK